MSSQTKLLVLVIYFLSLLLEFPLQLREINAESGCQIKGSAHEAMSKNGYSGWGGKGCKSIWPVNIQMNLVILVGWMPMVIRF